MALAGAANASRLLWQVDLRQTGLAGQTTRVRLYAQRLGESTASEPFLVSEKTVELDKPRMTIPLVYRPTTTGQFDLFVEADALDDEVLDEDNISPKRDVSVSDESLNLLFVEYEPSWE